MFEQITAVAELVVPKYKWRCIKCSAFLEGTVGHNHDDGSGLRRSYFLYLNPPKSELEAYGASMWAELLRASIKELPPPEGFKMVSKPPWIADPEGTTIAWYTDAEQILALGVPDPDDHVHDCEIMGCGRLHVLFRDLLKPPV